MGATKGREDGTLEGRRDGAYTVSCRIDKTNWIPVKIPPSTRQTVAQIVQIGEQFQLFEFVKQLRGM
jgi:hypothetical protein